VRLLYGAPVDFQQRRGTTMDIDTIDVEALARFVDHEVGAVRTVLMPHPLEARLAAATSVARAWEVYELAPRESPLREAARRRVDALLRSMLERATTRRGVLAVFRQTEPGSVVEQEALRKLATWFVKR
jgi:hypothetical protein